MGGASVLALHCENLAGFLKVRLRNEQGLPTMAALTLSPARAQLLAAHQNDHFCVLTSLWPQRLLLQVQISAVTLRIGFSLQVLQWRFAL